MPVIKTEKQLWACDGIPTFISIKEKSRVVWKGQQIYKQQDVPLRQKQTAKSTDAEFGPNESQLQDGYLSEVPSSSISDMFYIDCFIYLDNSIIIVMSDKSLKV